MGLGDRIGNGDLEGIINGDAEPGPQHLVFMVNGIIGSASDWKFAAERMKFRFGSHVAIHCSGSSAALKTFDGVDVMGKRLAAEVREVIDKTPGVTKISFVAHSLGGLVARYAIALLYCPPKDSQDLGFRDSELNGKIRTEAAESQGTIGGLQPVNFITLATPHLGCKGTEQLPFLLGIGVLEKTAVACAHWFVGQSGKHLFLTDGSDTELPLLIKMVTDCEEGQFMSSLAAFKRRTAYANVVNDSVVGWRTSSIRRLSEMPELDSGSVDERYPHIVREEDPSSPRLHDGEEGQDSLEEVMVVGLMLAPWHRVDVRFQGELVSFQAHNLIQVKNPNVHYKGSDVIEHVIDKHFLSDLED